VKPRRVYAENVDPGALAQFESALEQPFAVRGALMPDAHLGYALPIGAVVATRGVVVPAWVGYDIGCGMCALPTRFDAQALRENARAIFDDIYRVIPVGFAHNRAETPWPQGEALEPSSVLAAIFARDGLHQLGSLGSGNHFIEIGTDEQARVWVVIHSGSRGVGHATATHYMKLAAGGGHAREGHDGLALVSAAGREYLSDQRFCLAFALENRLEMMRRVLAVLRRQIGGKDTSDGGTWDELINRHHNHVEERDGMWIHRKGATHAEAGMMGVVPGNMRDGSFIVRGRGNPEALWSSAHGAGRVLGRNAARRTLALEGFRAQMRGITARVEAKTLDESPAAYKDLDAVMAQQRELVEVVARVRPVVNVKG